MFSLKKNSHFRKGFSSKLEMIEKVDRDTRHTGQVKKESTERKRFLPTFHSTRKEGLFWPALKGINMQNAKRQSQLKHNWMIIL